MTVPALAACCGTLVAGAVDARTGFIPDRIVIVTASLALAVAFSAGHEAGAVAGAALCGGALLALHLFTRGRGLGLGDVKLAAAIGCGLGPAAGAGALGIAFVAGGAYGVFLLATGRAAPRSEVRFGPFLAAGTLIAALGWTCLP